MKVKRYIRILAAILLAIALPSCGVFRPITDVPAHPSETTASDTTDVLTPEASVEDIPIANIPEDVLPPEKKVVSFVGAGDNIVYYGNVRDAASCAVAAATSSGMVGTAAKSSSTKGVDSSCSPMARTARERCWRTVTVECKWFLRFMRAM